VVKPHAWRNVQ